MPGRGAGADRGLSTVDPAEAVRSLLLRLATIGDEGDPADYRAAYSADVDWRWGADVQTGIDAVVAAAVRRRAEGTSGPGTGTRHEVEPRVVRVDGDTATATSSFRFVHTSDGEVLVAGRYVDDLVRTPDGWRIRRREVRVPARSVAGLLAAAADDAADVVALVEGERRLTYAELDAAVRDRAAAWSTAGLRTADRVAVHAVPTLDRAVEMLAVVAAGGVLVPLNPRYTGAEVRGILEPARCRFLVGPPDVGGRDLLTEVEHPDAGLAAIPFTSGSTGRPKGVLLREEPMLVSAAGWAATVGLRRGDVFPLSYPLAHVGGLKTGLLSPFSARATVVLLPEVSRAALVATARGPVDVLSAPPAALGHLLDAVRSGELPRPARLRTVVTGSTVVSPELVRAVLDELGAADVVVAYGLTEATGVVTMTRPGDRVELVCETIGAPVDDVEVRRGPGGELQVRGPTVMAGYLDDAEATAAVVDADGWLRTGDLAEVGDDGYVRIVGRAGDTVIVGGFNVQPAEVERVLTAHPAVLEAAVVGAPDERVGEVPVAFVVLRAGATATATELVAWCAGQLADFKVPRRLRLVEDLPRAAAGKVAREELRRLAPDVRSTRS